MSGILRRELLWSYEVRNGVPYIIPLDWCRVKTEIGEMLEPRLSAFPRTTPGVSYDAIDFKDEALMVNAIEYIDYDKFCFYHDNCFSMHLEPRTGR